jgi:hypothetical protein
MGSCQSSNCITDIIHNGSHNIQLKDNLGSVSIFSESTLMVHIRNYSIIIEDGNGPGPTNYVVRAPLQISHIYVNGSGDLSVDRFLLNSTITCSLEGTGDLHCNYGVFDKIKANLIGSGNMKFNDSVTKELIGESNNSTGVLEGLVVTDKMIINPTDTSAFKKCHYCEPL